MNSYYTEIDIERCKKIIDTIIMSQRFLPGRLIGEVDGYDNKFHIRKTKDNYRNSFARFFYGELIKKENGTIIQGEFHIHTVTKMACIIFAVIIILVWTFSLITFLLVFFSGVPIDYSHALKGLLAPPGLLMFEFAVIKLGVEVCEENYVLEFIETILEATEIEE
ncbi:hypothetical protein [Clostridium beijerinckii]|uniref:hypothetical protein n=1 Tax=Clostridium beijerinckii TaxID=1520 RepID=UPI00157044BF|nr:hypothetical protein [Clostridium beijerinckii]NRT73830.1 hypothetical protein [Clostridium beijerinckii]